MYNRPPIIEKNSDNRIKMIKKHINFVTIQNKIIEKCKKTTQNKKGETFFNKKYQSFCHILGILSFY